MNLGTIWTLYNSQSIPRCSTWIRVYPMRRITSNRNIFLWIDWQIVFSILYKHQLFLHFVAFVEFYILMMHRSSFDEKKSRCWTIFDDVQQIQTSWKLSFKQFLPLSHSWKKNLLFSWFNRALPVTGFRMWNINLNNFAGFCCVGPLVYQVFPFKVHFKLFAKKYLVLL